MKKQTNKQTNKKQNKTEIVQILDIFFEMSFDTQTFKILVFASDIEF